MDGLIYAYHIPGKPPPPHGRFAAPAAGSATTIASSTSSTAADGRRRGDDSLDAADPRAGDPRAAHRSHAGSATSSAAASDRRHRRDDSYGGMEAARTTTTTTTQSSSSGSLAFSEHAHHQLLSQPFELRHGRRYLKEELSYLLPCDLAELQRQNVRTLLCGQVFGTAVCSPDVAKHPPRKVLDVGCGTGFWSAMCHDHFAAHGHPDVAFTGLDVAPLAPDLRRQGVNWRFVQHDLRRFPLPFDDEEFDLVMVKDIGWMLLLGTQTQLFVDEIIRVLRPGGTLEVWETDSIVRSLVPHPPPLRSQPRQDQEAAAATATFLIAAGTPFAPAQNKYIQQANKWITMALDQRNLSPAPCSRVAQVLYQEPDSLTDIGSHRVAIPLSEHRWERDNARHGRQASDIIDSPTSTKIKPRHSDTALTPDQAALRHTALLNLLQLIESLEPLMKEVSGKNSEEWSHWWGSMMADLLDPSKGALTGECLETGAWWARKIPKED